MKQVPAPLEPRHSDPFTQQVPQIFSKEVKVGPKRRPSQDVGKPPSLPKVGRLLSNPSTIKTGSNEDSADSILRQGDS